MLAWFHTFSNLQIAQKSTMAQALMTPITQLISACGLSVVVVAALWQSTASSGTGKLLYSGAISPSIVCGNGVTPQLTTSTSISED